MSKAVTAPLIDTVREAELASAAAPPSSPGYARQATPKPAIKVVAMPDTAIADEPGEPTPSGAVCKRCLSNDLIVSRRPGVFAFAKLFGYKVYRCRQCLTRTLW